MRRSNALIAIGSVSFRRHNHPQGAAADAVLQGRSQQNHFTIGCDC